MQVWKLIVPLLLLRYVLQKCFTDYLPHIYSFDPHRLNALCQIAIEENKTNQGTTTDLFQRVAALLQQEYGPGLINDYNDQEWIFNNAGGAMGQMFILHASFTEYIILFGTAVGNEGHTGVHYATDYFNILQGVQWAGSANATTREKYEPGMMHILNNGASKQYAMEPESFALELAQGYIPFMLPFGMLDTLTSTLDFTTLFNTVYLTAKSMLKSAMHGKL